MKQLKKILFTILPVLMISISACTKGDLTKPTIKIVKPVNRGNLTDKEALDELIIGEPIDLEIIFTDDVGLQGYDIDIHWGEDHGNHSVAARPGTITRSDETVKNKNERETFTYKKSFQISGKRVIIKNKDIVIPAGKRPGKYHFGVTCVDASGNSSVAWLNNLYLVD